MITLRLPVPPSLNNLYPTVIRKEGGAPSGLASANRIGREQYLAAVTGAKPKMGRIKSAKYKDWVRAANSMCLMQKANLRGKIIFGKWAVAIGMPAGTPDLDNRIKPLLDFLVNLGLTPDDRHARLVLIGEDPALVGECEVCVRGIANASFSAVKLADVLCA